MTQRDNDSNEGRRRFLRGATAGVIAVPIFGLLGNQRAHAAEKLDPNSSQAKALSYVHDASEASGNAAFQEGANCANCIQWTGGSKEWGGCNIFPGKLVHADGWCAAWAKAG